MDDKNRTRNPRPHKTAEKVPSKDLASAYRVAATLVADHGDEYLPLFERLDREMRARDEKRAIRDRATEVAKRSLEDTRNGP